MDIDAQGRLLTAAYDLDMSPMTTALMSTKRTWSDIYAMRDVQRYDVFISCAEHAPGIARLKQVARTDEQAMVADLVPDFIALGTSVTMLNSIIWDRKRNDDTLQWAARHGEQAVVEMLASAPGIDLNARDEFGMTPLHLAVLGEHIGIVNILIKSPGIVVDARDDWNMTPLDWALFKGYSDAVKVLRKGSKVDNNVRNGNVEPPLDMADKWRPAPIVDVVANTPAIEVGFAGNKE